MTRQEMNNEDICAYVVNFMCPECSEFGDIVIGGYYEKNTTLVRLA